MYHRLFHQKLKSRGKNAFFGLIQLIFFMQFVLFFDGTTIPQLAVSQVNTPDVNLAAIFNNRANQYLIQLNRIDSKSDCAKLDTAIAYYQKAIELDSNDGGIKLNLGIAYLVKGDTTAADSCFELGLIQCDSSLEKTFFLLQIETGAKKEDKGSAANVSKEKLKKRIQGAKMKIDSKKTSGTASSSAGRKPKIIRVAGPRGLDPQQVKDYLYYKQ
jgi:tetratricopeptide (TPR) repeat protein